MGKTYTIYMHKNKINSKVYIGQTCTTLKCRFGKNGIYYIGCPAFYRAIQKYGWNNFEHIVLEENISDLEMANNREKYYISLYNSTEGKYGYNIQAGGNEQTLLSKNVYQYSLNGEYIKSYNSIADATRDNNLCEGKISDCCNGKRKSTGGYMWSYFKHHCMTEYTCDTNSRTVHKYALSGKYIKTYEHLSDAVKEMNLINGGHISSCCNGNRQTAYGFMWRYEKYSKIQPIKNRHNQGIKVIQFSKDKSMVLNVFENLIDAAQQFGDKSKNAYMSINNCLNKKSKSAYGYYWEYAI